MAEDASERLTSLSGSVSSLQLSSLLFPKFDRKTELLSYLILCVSKMPFIPPVSLARSVSGLSEREKPAGGPLPAPPAPASAPVPPPPAKARVPREDRGGSVTERLALNLKQLRRKSPAPSQLPAARGAKGGELHAKRKEHSLPSKTRSDGLPASSSGESLSKAPQRKPLETEARGGGGGGGGVPRRLEEARFTLTLTPEAVLLLQRRNNERNQRSAASAEARRRRDNPSKRHQVQRHATPNGRSAAAASAVGAPAKSPSQTQLRDVSSFVKISLLNEQHKYDDVEYEEQEAQGVDERVVLKCTEWLRGLESTPVTVRSSLSRGATVKTF